MVGAGRFTTHRSLAGSLGRDRGTLLLGLTAGGMMIVLGALAGGWRVRAGDPERISPSKRTPVVESSTIPTQPTAHSRPAPVQIAVAPEIRVEEVRKKRSRHSHKPKQAKPPMIAPTPDLQPHGSIDAELDPPPSAGTDDPPQIPPL